MEKIKFYKMHVFKYSPKKGTVAEKMPDQIDGNIKEERSQKLIKLSNKNETEYNKQYIGKVINVLFEEKDEQGNQVIGTFERGKALFGFVPSLELLVKAFD